SAFKDVATSDYVMPGAQAGQVTNLLALRFQAPNAGYVFASATGYCNIPSGNASTHYVIYVATAPGAQFDTALQGAAFVRFQQAPNMAQVPFSVSRSFHVKTGQNALFLNFQNFTGLAGYSCQANLVGFFSGSQLPGWDDHIAGHPDRSESTAQAALTPARRTAFRRAPNP
ncbi:MAG TPA: hypothetical protein VMK12_11855, partial [Anaeromyxobacteraceae bacterium]|nr:hypothetical protein [Anaeromyxobacteraceae bacterium]